MILYTVLPLEDVLEGIDEEPTPTMMLSLNGLTLEVEQLEGFQARVVRLHSTDPEYYLVAHCQPGSIIHLGEF
ncbi:MAG TPA: hypothetical protein DDZ66_00395 [Firmicutes bacterium]|jgi:hypothetical protein|nr:hypothetical protein [Bacillota bacterium]